MGFHARNPALMFRPPTDDVRIEGLRPLMPPAILMEEIHPGEEGIGRITEARQADQRHRARQGRPAGGGRGSLLDSRPTGRARLRQTPQRTTRQTRRRPLHRDANLLREAAHDGRLEGADQRPQARRQLRHQSRAPRGARASQLAGRARFACWDRVPRSDFTAVRRRPGVLGSDRRTYHREPGASRARKRPVDAGGLQERNARHREDRGRRAGVKAARNPHHFLSVTKQGLTAIVATKGNLDCHVILRGGAGKPNYQPEHELAETVEMLQGRGPRGAAHGRLQPREQRQGS